MVLIGWWSGRFNDLTWLSSLWSCRPYCSFSSLCCWSCLHSALRCWYFVSTSDNSSLSFWLASPFSPSSVCNLCIEASDADSFAWSCWQSRSFWWKLACTFFLLTDISSCFSSSWLYSCSFFSSFSLRLYKQSYTAVQLQFCLHAFNTLYKCLLKCWCRTAKNSLRSLIKGNSDLYFILQKLIPEPTMSRVSPGCIGFQIFT